MQVLSAGRRQVVKRQVIVRMIEQDVRWQNAIGEQFTRTVQISQHQVEQFRSLLQRGFDLGPFVAGHQMREWVQLKMLAANGRISIGTVGNTVLVNHAADLFPAMFHFPWADIRQLAGEFLPGRSQVVRRVEDFIVDVSRRSILAKEIRLGRVEERLELGRHAGKRQELLLLLLELVLLRLVLLTLSLLILRARRTRRISRVCLFSWFA